MSTKIAEEKPPQRGRSAVRNGGRNGKRQIRILGPVENLEEHVHPDWWRTIFNSLYLKTDADVVNDQDITKMEVDLFMDVLSLNSTERILDLCCGQGRHTLELARRGFTRIEGLDRSHYLVQKGKDRARKENLDVRFREGDARKLPYPPDTFDVVMLLGNSFGYFDTVHDDLKVLKEICRVLKPWGRLIINVTDGDFLRNNYQSRSWEWLDRKHFVCRERSLSRDGRRLISREVINQVDKGVIADQFYAERLYDQQGLSDLLEEAGFNNIDFHGHLPQCSKRKQDLGMMECSIIVTSVIRKEWTKPKNSVPAHSSIAVLLGDPRKPDQLKPQSVFDDDDFYTIDQLKAALHELKHYHVIYLDRHDTLFRDLQRLKGKMDFVVNLCDEGFDNDARKELHIPALLEQLGISYTGAGPQCLAYCYDKSLVRGIAKEMGITVPEALYIKPEDSTFELLFDFPLIVKPNFGDSSFGITQNSVVNTHEELVTAIAEIRDKFGYDKPVLVEEFLTGKDLSVGIIGNPPESYTIFPIIEEDYSRIPDGFPRICGYEAKWMPDSPYWNITSIPADLPEETQKQITEWCVRLFERLECKDYCRLDWRLDAQGEPHLLEVNPNPGWCWDGHLAKMAKFAGLSYPMMIARILGAAAQRLCIDSEETQTITG